MCLPAYAPPTPKSASCPYTDGDTCIDAKAVAKPMPIPDAASVGAARDVLWDDMDAMAPMQVRPDASPNAGTRFSGHAPEATAVAKPVVATPVGIR
jgi:hypothetical protein